MNRFGELLRFYRLRCRDPRLPQKVLTQARLGELVGEALGDAGYTGAAISEWELGKSRLAHDQRRVLVGLLKVLHACGGLRTPEAADTLLLAGDYRALNPDERKQVAGVWEMEGSASPSEGLWRMIGLFLLAQLAQPGQALGELLRATKEHPRDWTGATLDWLGQHTRNWSGVHGLRLMGWLGLWWLTWGLTFPLLRWPFLGPEQAHVAALLYVLGAMTVPLGAGALTRTREDEFWVRQGLTRTGVLRMFTHQGAHVGFHLGYMMIFMGALAGYYLGFGSVPRWVESLVAVWPVALSHVAARQVPFNLWRAYKGLRFTRADLGPTLAFTLFGPLWAWFFLLIQGWLLWTPMGVVLIWCALTLCAGLAAWQRQPGQAQPQSTSKGGH